MGKGKCHMVRKDVAFKKQNTGKILLSMAKGKERGSSWIIPDLFYLASYEWLETGVKQWNLTFWKHRALIKYRDKWMKIIVVSQNLCK